MIQAIGQRHQVAERGDGLRIEPGGTGVAAQGGIHLLPRFERVASSIEGGGFDPVVRGLAAGMHRGEQCRPVVERLRLTLARQVRSGQRARE